MRVKSHDFPKKRYVRRILNSKISSPSRLYALNPFFPLAQHLTFQATSWLDEVHTCVLADDICGTTYMGSIDRAGWVEGFQEYRGGTASYRKSAILYYFENKQKKKKKK